MISKLLRLHPIGRGWTESLLSTRRGGRQRPVVPLQGRLSLLVLALPARIIERALDRRPLGRSTLRHKGGTYRRCCTPTGTRYRGTYRHALLAQLAAPLKELALLSAKRRWQRLGSRACRGPSPFGRHLSGSVG